MFLNQLFSPVKLLTEGGNVSSKSPGWVGMPGDHAAQEIDLKLHDRDYMVGQLRTLLQAQNESFKAAYGRYIWDPKTLAGNRMFSGSSLHFFDVKGISTQDFLNKLKILFLLFSCNSIIYELFIIFGESIISGIKLSIIV